MFTDWFNSNGTVGINGTETVSFGVKKLSEGIFEVSSPVAATLTVNTTAGAEVHSQELQAGRNVVRLNAPRGVYIFSANAEGFHKVQKVVTK